ncbi:histidine phosphatase family protein [Paucibacter sp. APW11]|uniref:Histidine phosphatase family protein n=1 Tax=Roseateles aquae TaxID=3077235 RepID=A0ABU3P7L2_9BURK|nr:histidine phosphatase family protein [Paucibacter sp. APW11]MDT8998302.1 histidine phosphatase family protein [Paucibacter sp. APW11]
MRAVSAQLRTCMAAAALLCCLPVVRADAYGMPPPAASRFDEVPGSAQTLEQLRRGGFVLYLRHGATDNSKPDRATGVDLNDCSTQRPLSAEGHKMAVRVGEAMRKARIPIGDILISPLCRVRDTVADAFPGQAYVLDQQLMYTANFTDVQKAPIIARTRQLLSTAVAAGNNRLLIAHAPNLMDLMGYFPKEATLVVFRPLGEKGGFEYVASIPPALWGELLRPGRP